MEKQSVGLVTYYQNNLGGCLQAYALQQSIKKLGYNCDIIRYNINVDRKGATFFQKLSFLLHWKKNRQFAKDLAAFNQSAAAFDRFREQHLLFSPNEPKKALEYYHMDFPYDAFVCGSDQIWNPELTDFCSPIYFLDFVPDEVLKIAYAPSIAVSSIKTKYQKDFIRYVERFQSVSVREPAGTHIVNTLTNQKAITVLDPTLLLEATDYEKLMLSDSPKEDYIFCYAFGDGDHILKAKEELKQKTGLPIKCIPYQARELYSHDEKIGDAGPCEFLSLIKHAKYVITDSFHATVFSINFKVPFFTFIRQHGNKKANMSSRISGILGQLGLENRILTSEQALPLDSHIDFERVHEQLRELKCESLEYLKNSLAKGLQ